MAGRFLLDTNIVIALFAGEPDVLQHLQDADQVYIPAVVVGELYFGARKSGRVNQNLTRVDQFAARNVILACDFGGSQEYALVKKELLDKGRPIPENDIWIAAIARHHKLTLVSRDGHFSEVSNLQVDAW